MKAMPYTTISDLSDSQHAGGSSSGASKSFNSMEGLSNEYTTMLADAATGRGGLAGFLKEPVAISEVKQLQCYLNELFSSSTEYLNATSTYASSSSSSISSNGDSHSTLLFLQRKKVIRKILDMVDLSQACLNKYCFWDGEKPYTRNLVATDDNNYTLLLLCWNPGAESRVHNHPCDGCFVKTLVGSIKETVYTVVDSSDIQQKSCRFFTEGQVSFMADSMGLHKITNPNKSAGCISLHLYTPPFSKCKTWESAGTGAYTRPVEGRMGYFSCYGYRTPQYEGRPGRHALMLSQIKAMNESSAATTAQNT